MSSYLFLSSLLAFISPSLPFRTSPDGIEVLTRPNGLYQLARRLCIVLNQPKLSDALLTNAVRRNHYYLFPAVMLWMEKDGE